MSSCATEPEVIRRDGLALKTFLVMVLSYGIANILPAVEVNTSFGGAWYHPGTRPVNGWLCTLLHPAGWMAAFVMLFGFVLLLLVWLRRKRLYWVFVMIPISAFCYAVYTSFALLHSDPESKLLSGHYVWLFSMGVGIIYYGCLARKSANGQ